MNPEPIDTRLLRLTDALIFRGVPPLEAANIAAKTLIEGDRFNPKPWLTPDEASLIVNLNPQVIERRLRAGAHEFKGAKKFGGKWHIPRAVVYP